jgi:hypothetical protein
VLNVVRKPESPAASLVVKEIGNFIAGEYVASSSGSSFDKRSPVYGALIAHVSEAGKTEINAAVRAARVAPAAPWGKTRRPSAAICSMHSPTKSTNVLNHFSKRKWPAPANRCGSCAVSIFRAAPKLAWDKEPAS